MSTLFNIATGWYNYIEGSQYTKDLMKYRLEKCDTCPFKKQLSAAGQLLVTSINHEGSLFKCEKCGCPLAAATAAPKKECPIGRWGMAGTEVVESMY